MRWLEGFERCAELAARLPDTRWVYVAVTGNAISTNSWSGHAGNRRSTGPDRATHNRYLAGVTIGGTDWRWRWSWARCASSSRPGRTGRAGRWC